MICIELPHSFSLFTVLDGFPIDFYLVLYVAILSRPLFILILSLILFRQFKKFSKLLHPLSLHLPCIHHLPIRLQPIQHIMLLNPMPRRIPMVLLQESHHFIVSHYPAFVLRHIYHLSLVGSQQGSVLVNYLIRICFLKCRILIFAKAPWLSFY